MNAVSFECRFCKASLFPEKWGGAECPECESVNVHRLPDDDELAGFYERYVQSYQGGGGSEGRNQARYARRYLELVRQCRQRGRLLDVGSSTNPFPNMASDAGFDVEVMDFVRPPGLRPEVGFNPGRLDSRMVSSSLRDRFDIVTCWAVLEHVPDPGDAILALGKLVAPGGWCLVMVPEQGSWLTRDVLGRSPWFYPPEHLHLASPRAIVDTFARNGMLLQHLGRLELDALRFVARYGTGVLETLFGRTMRLINPQGWADLRKRRVHRFKGMLHFAFKREGI